MEKYNIIIDTSNLVHRTYHARKKDLNLSKIEDVNKLINKVMVDYQAMIRRVGEGNILNVYFCFDSPSFRKKLYPEYKGNGTKDDLSIIFDRLYKLLVFKGLNAIKVDGLEGDDIVALIVERLGYDNPNIIISQDRDLLQLIRPKTYVLTPLNKNRSLHKSFYSKSKPSLNCEVDHKDCNPVNELIEKVLYGCTSDNIPRLAPKGFRKNIMEKMFTDFVRLSVNKSLLESFSDLFYEYKKYFNIDDERINKQLRMVCLKREYMPESSVERFDSINLVDNTEEELNAINILSNTAYFL